jgi:aspartate kinase
MDTSLPIGNLPSGLAVGFGIKREFGPMVRIVQKFGGTSVADVEHIGIAAKRVKAEVERGNDVAVVVSAMSGVTNQLIEYVRQTSELHDTREYDVVLSAGEQVTSALMALALNELGVPARSWLGWQVPVYTDDVHGNATISQIITDDIVRRFADGQVPVLAGFQGVSPENRITTLGRGGSDASAVSLAAALDADRCDIFTDVDGVYTTDPRIVTGAQKLENITYEEMLEMASLGAKVLQARSVVLAMRGRVRLQVLSILSDASGTLVVQEDEIVEQRVVSGIAYSRDEAKITLLRVDDQPGVAAAIFGPLADAGINVDMIVQNIAADGQKTDITFTVSRADVTRTLKMLDDIRDAVPYDAVLPDPNVVKVSVIGVGMRAHAGVAKAMFQTLADEGINILLISTSEIKISILIDEKYTELAVRALHTTYGLDEA